MALSVARAASHAKKDVAQGSLSSPSADGRPFHREAGLAGRENSDYLAWGAARTRTAGKAAGPESGPCATRLEPDVRKAFRSERAVNDALRLVIESPKVGSYKRRDYSSNGD